MQPDPFATAGVVPDSEIKRVPTWRPEADPRPLWLHGPMQPAIPETIRVTQVRMGEQCGMQYRLVSRDGVPEVPAWWNAGGTALHECAKQFEEMWASGNYDTALLAQLDDLTARAWWEHEFGRAIAATEAEAPFPRHQWRAAAKGEEGHDWWAYNGPQMVRDYAAASAQWHAEGWEILRLPFPTAQDPAAMAYAMELEMRYGLPIGGELVGHLDQAWWRVGPDGVTEIRIRDLKSGSKPPEDTWQLDAYTMLLRARLGATNGADVSTYRWSAVYYDARNGKDGEVWTVLKPGYMPPEHFAAIAYRASSVYRMHDASNYPANPGDTWKAPCYLCPVRYACPIMALRD